VSEPDVPDISPVTEFLRCRTPSEWVACAVTDIPTLLLDHASLELKAAQQAQKIMSKYGAGTGGRAPTTEVRLSLLNKMSRLAREELRHFEQVLGILEKRGLDFVPVSASRYAAQLHEHIRQTEPERLIDTLIVGAIIEARSCERFCTLMPQLEQSEPALAGFYGSLLKSEARHFMDYLGLAEQVAGCDLAERTGFFLEREAALIQAPDTEMRFHSGVPG